VLNGFANRLFSFCSIFTAILDHHAGQKRTKVWVTSFPYEVLSLHMVRQEMTFENLALLLSSQGMRNLPELTPHFPKQDLPPALRDEDHMVFAVPLRVG